MLQCHVVGMRRHMELHLVIHNVCLICSLIYSLYLRYRRYEYVLCRDFPQEQLERVMGSAEAAAPPGSQGAGGADRQPLNPWQAQHATLICVTVKVGTCSAGLPSSLSFQSVAAQQASDCRPLSRVQLLKRGAGQLGIERCQSHVSSKPP